MSDVEKASKVTVSLSFPLGTILCAAFVFLKLFEIGTFATASWLWAPVLFFGPFLLSMSFIMLIMAIIFIGVLIISFLDR